MAKKKAKAEFVNVAEMQPDELNELKKVLGEFLTRLQNIDNEIETLKESRKELFEEFADRLDMKMLQAALKVIKIESAIERRDAFEAFVEVLKDDATNGLVE